MLRILLFFICVWVGEVNAQKLLPYRYFNVQKEGEKYGFVDEYRKPILGGYIYDKAERLPYYEAGGLFGKVYKNGQKYLIDTLGQTYLLADSVSEITSKTEAVLLNNKKLTEWPEELKTAKQLKILSMSSNALTTIDKTALKQLKKLEILNLSINRIEELEPKTFKGLKRLRVLRLIGNNIAELPEDAFKGLRRLRDLGYPSGVEEINPADFKPLKRLENLDINSVELVPEGAFRHLRRLKSLDIYAVDEIAEFALSGLRGLERLELGDMEELPNNLFMGLAKLKRLDIYDIEEPLPNDFFIGAEKLAQLYISGVIDLDGDSFLGLDGLEALDLVQDDVWALKAGFFSNMPKLKALRLEEVIIKEAGCFKELGELEYLEIMPGLPEDEEDDDEEDEDDEDEDNEIGMLPYGVFEGLEKLEYLSLSDFDGTRGGIFEDVPQLRGLYLSDCGRVYARTFGSIERLEYIFVDGYDFSEGEEQKLVERWPRCRVIKDNEIPWEDVYIFPLD